jgi:hypothetical protein
MDWEDEVPVVVDVVVDEAPVVIAVVVAVAVATFKLVTPSIS